jgi:Trypsin-like peptidase domain
MFGRLVVLVFTLAGTGAKAACVDPAKLAHSAISIMRHFDDGERGEHSSVVGIRGTGWFLSPTTIVTAEHVTKAMRLTTEDWKPLEITAGDARQFVTARIQRLAGDSTEKLAVIELQEPPSGVQSVAIRRDPLVPEEQIATLAYPGGHPHFVQGRFVRFGEDGGKLAGLALLEIYEGENRLVIDHGASGAPVIDCEGRVAAVISNVFTQSFFWAEREIRMSTAWGMPNVVSVPAQLLQATPRAD